MFWTIFKTIKRYCTTKMVFIVRTDLKMSSGKIASQCAHAAIMLYDSSLKSNRFLLKLWLQSGQPKIVLKVDNNCQEVLKQLYDKAKNNNLNASLVYDMGKTQVECGTLTVLGIGPNDVAEIDKLTKSLKLL